MPPADFARANGGCPPVVALARYDSATIVWNDIRLAQTAGNTACRRNHPLVDFTARNGLGKAPCPPSGKDVPRQDVKHVAALDPRDTANPSRFNQQVGILGHALCSAPESLLIAASRTSLDIDDLIALHSFRQLRECGSILRVVLQMQRWMRRGASCSTAVTQASQWRLWRGERTLAARCSIAAGQIAPISQLQRYGTSCVKIL